MAGHQTARAFRDELQWQVTKLCSLAQQPYPAALLISLARQRCPAALPGSVARQRCPAVLPGSVARQRCPAVYCKLSPQLKQDIAILSLVHKLISPSERG
jgi:hypothetical protein